MVGRNSGGGLFSLSSVICSDVFLDGLNHAGPLEPLFDSGVRANDS